MNATDFWNIGILLFIMAGIGLILWLAKTAKSDTAEELMDDIRDARDVDDLVSIAATWAPFAFGENEKLAFEKKATVLKLTIADWGNIHTALRNGEGGLLKKLAQEKMGMGGKL